MRLVRILVAVLLSLTSLSCETIPETPTPDPFWALLADQPTLILPPTAENQDRVAVVRMNVQISDSTADTMIKLMDEAETKADYILVEIDSPGGDAYPALRILSRFLKATKPVACIVPHLAASGAFLVLQGCRSRGVMSGAVLMMHRASYHDPLLDLVHSKDLEEIDSLMGYFACRRLNLTNQDCRAMYADGDWWMSEVEAVMYGAADALVGSTQSVTEALQSREP